MTNNWSDIGNSTCVVVMGANPAENHPACMAHINAARKNKSAKLIVIDPRKTRTAAQADTFVRIRPGTDIAFINGVVRGIIEYMENNDNAVTQRFYEYLNQSGNGTFFTDGTATVTTVTDEKIAFAAATGGTATLAKPRPVSGTLVVSSGAGGSGTVYAERVPPATTGGDYSVTYATGVITRVAGSTIPSDTNVYATYDYTGSYTRNVAGSSQQTDARFLVATNGSDYQRETISVGTADQISSIPMKATDCRGDANTVYRRLKAHVDPYSASLVASICGCTEADVATIVNAYISNSRCSSNGTLTNYSVGLRAGDPGAWVQLPIQFTGDAVVKDSSDVVVDPAGYEWDKTIGRIRLKVGTAAGTYKVTVSGSVSDPRNASYKVATMLYAMGLTQHTHGSQNVKSFAVLQSLMGNVGRAGGGINALRGIHNVQGSTDMGVLAHLIPFYSNNPTVQTSADADAFGKFMDMQWGLPLNGTGGRTTMNASYDDAYNLSGGVMGLQQRGFINMTYNFFGNYSWMNKSDAATPGFTNPSTNQIDRTKTNELYDLWPKTNGDMHIEMFRKMKAGTITAAVVWGQNPAITEPNQSFIRDGLENLETLVVVDMFENETAACKRKTAGVTYLIPAASHVEKAGSAANSGRVLQWRERATKPKGNSKSDMELLFRFAHALNGASAFTHITDKWTSIGKTGLNAYTVLYGDRYGWTPGGATAFDDVSGTADIWRGAGAAPSSGLVYGQEWIAEQMFREMCTGTTGTSWLYTGAYSTDKTTNKHTGQADWLVDNRAKSRATADPNGTLAYPGWGYSWLVNRRVLYNNSQVPGDVADFYMGPDSCARLYVTTETRNGVDLNYSRWYRFYHRLSDVPDVAGVHVLPGRFPGHTEPYETPASAATLASFGRNTKGGGQWDLVPTDSAIFGKNRTLKAGAPAPLVLTTIRCVEHFQGGPITRNNPYNHEAEPEPWIELNSVDAVRFGIKDGDWVNVVTARSNSTTQQEGRSNQAAGWAKGFKARVGVGPTSNQRVGPGVAAIPWHWGEMGLSKGSRANDLCVDAFDANTRIPESKACLCWVTKTVSATPATFVDGGV